MPLIYLWPTPPQTAQRNPQEGTSHEAIPPHRPEIDRRHRRRRHLARRLRARHRPGQPVRIGILAPRSGIAASAGESGLRATQWAVERFNAAGGIAGRKIELVVDEETNAKDTIERFQKLVQQDKVDCVQGIVSTGVGLALGPVVEEARALTIFWDGTTQDGVDEKLPNPKYLFRSTDNECEAVMSSLLAIKHWKGQFKRIAGINPGLLLRPQQHGGVHRAAEALQHRA